MIYSRDPDAYSGTPPGRRPDALPPEEPFDVYPVDWKYAPEGLERMRWGLTPGNMDDKWYVYLEGDELFMFRSASGALCYKVRLTPTSIDRIRIARSVPRHEWHLTYVRWLVEYRLVGREWPFPP